MEQTALTDVKALRHRLGNTGCSSCCGLGYAHFDHGEDPKILACDECVPAGFSDDDARRLHDLECPCDFLVGGPEVLEMNVAMAVFGNVAPRTFRVRVAATLCFDVTARSDA